MAASRSTTVPAAIAAADIGIAPTRRDRFTDLSLSTKVYEYAAMGKPVVASSPAARGTDLSCPVPSATYEASVPAAMAGAIAALADDETARLAAVGRASAIVQAASWERVSARYLQLLEGIIAR